MFQEEGLELASLDVSDEEAGQRQDKDSRGEELIASTRHSLDGVDPQESDGLLTLSTQWQDSDSKIDYFI